MSDNRCRRWLVSVTVGVVVLLCLVATGAAMAAEPMARVVLGTSSPIRPGQQVTVDVTVLVPNFFMAAPDFPLFQVPGAVVTMPDARALNATETLDGATFAAITRTYAFAADQDGDYVLPPVAIDVTYAGDDGAAQHAKVTLPTTRIRVGAGGTPALTSPARKAGEGGQRATLPVAKLTVTQSLTPAAGQDGVQLRAGDTLVRTVTTFAPDTQAMRIQPPKAQAPRGVRVFAADPKLSDGVSPNVADPVAGGLRVDTFSYVFERRGTYTLPAITLDWIDPASGQRERSEAPALRVVVAPGAPTGGMAPGGTAWFSRGDDGRVGAVLEGIAMLAMLSVVAYALWRARGLWPAVRQRYVAWRTRPAVQARALHAMVVRACLASDPDTAYRAADRWSRYVVGMGLPAWARATGDVALGDSVVSLERRLFGETAKRFGEGAWDGKPLAEAFGRCARMAGGGRPEDVTKCGQKRGPTRRPKHDGSDDSAISPLNPF
ncbi:BatD family protein [Pandoraea anhela]|nr:BatD family protein [Pandoraea anhela]